jgi:hypothetical protein
MSRGIGLFSCERPENADELSLCVTSAVFIQLRVWFYLLHLATRDEEVQKNGYIVINSIKGFDVSKHYDRMLGKQSFDLVKKAMPAPLRASHACLGLSMPAIKLVAPSSRQMAGKHIRLRAVSHAGSNQEMLDSMANYGLFAPNICEHLGGGFTQDNLLDWVGEQKSKENESLSRFGEESSLEP